MLNTLLAFMLSAHARLKFEDFESAALTGASVLAVDCPGGYVLVERDEQNFWEHFGTVKVPVTPVACEKLVVRASAALRCYGHARIDLFLEHLSGTSTVIVDAGFVRREGPCE